MSYIFTCCGIAAIVLAGVSAVVVFAGSERVRSKGKYVPFALALVAFFLVLAGCLIK